MNTRPNTKWERRLSLVFTTKYLTHTAREGLRAFFQGLTPRVCVFVPPPVPPPTTSATANATTSATANATTSATASATASAIASATASATTSATTTLNRIHLNLNLNLNMSLNLNLIPPPFPFTPSSRPTQLLTYSAVKFSLFSLYEQFRSILGSPFLAGGMAGALNAVVSCPQDLLKSQVRAYLHARVRECCVPELLSVGVNKLPIFSHAHTLTNHAPVNPPSSFRCRSRVVLMRTEGRW